MARPNFESIKAEALAKVKENKMAILNGKQVSDDFNTKESSVKAPQYDNVNRPKHYNREGGMESIDEMALVFGIEAVKNFCLCNVWKYRYRAADKNGEEDLRKSDWYMNKYKELCDSQTYSCKKANDDWWG